jgi:hypothetical protein
MANVRLEKRFCTGGRLPWVCLICGNSADNWKRITFSYRPLWIDLFMVFGLPLWIILTILLTKRMRVECPVCEMHRTYWKRKERKTYAFAASLFLGTIVLIALATLPESDTLQIASFVLIMVNVLVSITGMIVVNVTGVRPRRINKYDITLKGVSSEFANALDDLQERADRPLR